MSAAGSPLIGAQKPSLIAWKHRAVVDDDHVDLLVAFLRLQLGERVGGVAGDVLDLDVVLLERRNDFLAHRLLERAAVAGDVEGLLLGLGTERAGERHDGEHALESDRCNH